MKLRISNNNNINTEVMSRHTLCVQKPVPHFDSLISQYLKIVCLQKNFEIKINKREELPTTNPTKDQSTMAGASVPPPSELELSASSARSSVAGGRLALPWVFRDDLGGFPGPDTPPLPERALSLSSVVSESPRSLSWHSSRGFFYQSALDSAVVVTPQVLRGSNGSGGRFRSRVLAAAAAVLKLNAVQRVLSALVLAPLITIFLWQSPAMATATFCTFVTSICSYEYSWLAHRIHLRVVAKVKLAERELHAGSGSEAPPATGSVSGANATGSTTATVTFGNGVRNRTHSSRTSSSGSSDSDGCCDAATDCQHQSAAQPQPETLPGTQVPGRALVTASSSTAMTASSSASHYFDIPQPAGGLPAAPPASLTRIEPSSVAATPSVEAGNRADDDQECVSESGASDRTWASATNACDPSFSRCAVTDLSKTLFGGNEWLAGIVISTVVTAVTSTCFLIYVEFIPEVKNTDLYRLRWFYSIATDFVAALSGAFTPNWKYALICLVEKVVFTLLTMHSTSCPINRFSCGTSIEPSEVFLAGALLLFLFRLSSPSSSGGPAVFLHIALDMLGYLYIIGSLSVIVAFVDDERLESYRKLLIVLLYVVWASDTGAYLTGKMLEWMKYAYYNPLAKHLSKNKDYEGTFGAIVFGVVAMHVSSDLLDVPGSTVAQIGFTVLAVIVGRLGDLFESLLKRAAGVKDSGKLIPGHGGVLDRIDALMFASIVFARYYAMIVVP